jgi:transcriptional regulator with XRE-family HTH domain
LGQFYGELDAGERWRGIVVDVAFVRRRLRALREQQHLTQEQLGERADLSKNFISALERGTKSFSMETFLRYVEGLGVAPQDVFVSAGESAVGQGATPSGAQTLLSSWQALTESDRAMVVLCAKLLQTQELDLRQLLHLHLGVLEEALQARLWSREGRSGSDRR